jgi:hypothetical protein
LASGSEESNASPDEKTDNPGNPAI